MHPLRSTFFFIIPGMQPCKTKPQIDEDNRKCTHSQTNKQQQKITECSKND